jgi:peptidoglycan/LPS O-acetylase OafA/YrhL
LRIFPALVVFVLIAVFIFGPLTTALPVKEYFSNKYTYSYLLNIFLRISYCLPGVFEDLRMANVINGSLWSLPIEFFLYIVLALCSFMTTSKRYIYLMLFIISGILGVFWANRTDKMLVIYATDLRQFFLTGVYFWAGSVFFAFDLKRYFSIPRVIAAFIILLFLESHTNIIYPASCILLPYIILSFGLSSSLKELEWLTKLGDFSYGFYIYSFPIQQLVVMLKPDITISFYLLICSLLILPFAIFSWKIIEQPALLMKPKRN